MDPYTEGPASILGCGAIAPKGFGQDRPRKSRLLDWYVFAAVKRARNTAFAATGPLPIPAQAQQRAGRGRPVSQAARARTDAHGFTGAVHLGTSYGLICLRPAVPPGRGDIAVSAGGVGGILLKAVWPCSAAHSAIYMEGPAPILGCGALHVSRAAPGGPGRPIGRQSPHGAGATAAPYAARSLRPVGLARARLSTIGSGLEVTATALSLVTGRGPSRHLRAIPRRALRRPRPPRSNLWNGAEHGRPRIQSRMRGRPCSGPGLSAGFLLTLKCSFIYLRHRSNDT